jgi:hypothetical protein
MMLAGHMSDSPVLPQQRFMKSVLVPEHAENIKKTVVFLNGEESAHRNILLFGRKLLLQASLLGIKPI